MEQNELENLIFNLFEKKKFYSLDELIKETGNLFNYILLLII
jgi:hypothetical protein